MNGRGIFRLGAKALHEIGSIGFGGALLACLVINGMADRSVAAEFAAARQVFAAIARYVLIPSMAVVVLSGLFALAATRGYMSAGWAWLKALLGLSLFEATLLVVGSSSRHEELAAAIAAGDAAVVDALLRAERWTLLLLLALGVVNVLLAVFRPRLSARSG
jgi:hypothetical protein